MLLSFQRHEGKPKPRTSIIKSVGVMVHLHNGTYEPGLVLKFGLWVDSLYLALYYGARMAVVG